MIVSLFMGMETYRSLSNYLTLSSIIESKVFFFLVGKHPDFVPLFQNVSAALFFTLSIVIAI